MSCYSGAHSGPGRSSVSRFNSAVSGGLPMWNLQRCIGVLVIATVSWQLPSATGLLINQHRPSTLAPVRPSSASGRATGRVTPTCGLAVTIHIRGKRTGGEEWLNQGYQEYEKRLRPVLSLETVWHKTDEELLGAVEKDRASRIVCLDEHGKQFTSEEFADVLYKRLESGGSRLSIVIGGAEGLPPALKTGRELWSLSPMTFTHQWARVVLAEQIYRATEINKGSAYHKV